VSDATIHLCHGVGPGFTCYYEGACYGEICIAPGHCSIKPDAMTHEQRAIVDGFRAEMGYEPYQWPAPKENP